MKLRNRFLLFSFLAIAGCDRPASSPVKRIDAQTPRSFAPKQRRYYATDELIKMLQRTFSGISFESIIPDCRELTEANRAVLGDIMPQTGSPIFSAPSSSFVRWYVKCLNEYIERSPVPAEIYGPTVANEIRNGHYSSASPYASLPAPLRLAMAQEQIERLIGPSEVIADFGYFANSAALAQSILRLVPEAMSLQQAASRILILVATRDEFLSY